MNELVVLIQTSRKLDELIDSLFYISKDLKSSLDADNAELKDIKNEISLLKNEIEKLHVVNKTKLK